MPRHISCRYLLVYLCVSAILACGLSRRIPRRASCPSCSQDCPEALTVQLPWYPRQESVLQSSIPRDFSTSQNSLHSRLMQERMSQDVGNNNMLLNENAMSFGNYRSLPQQASTSENFIFKFPEYVDRRTTSQNDFAYEYPPVYVSPPKQFFDRSENLFLRNPRDQNSEFSLENSGNFQGYTENEDPANKMLVVYRADRNTEPSGENLKDASSSSYILPKRSFPKIENTFQLRRQDLDKEKSMIEETTSPANQEYDFTYLGKEYYPTNFDEIKPNYIVPQKIRKPTKNEKLFDNWDTNGSLRSSNLRQLMQPEDNFFRNPVDKQETIITEENNDYFNQNPYVSPQELNIWKPSEKEEFFNNFNFARKNSQEMKPAEMKRLQKAENNWLYPAMNTRYFDGENDEEYFENEENMNQDYFYDDIEKDTIMKDNYNPYTVFPDMNIWGPVPDEEFSKDLDFTHGNLQDVQKEEQLEMYPNKNNNHFQNEEKENTNIDKAHANADQIIHPRKINPYITNLFSRYFGILNNLRYPAESLKTQELSKPKSNIHVNSNENRNKRLFKDEPITNDAPKDPVTPTNILYIRKYKSPAVDTQNVKTNIQNETSTKFDPDLLDDIEDLPAEPTEPTSTDSPIELSTPQQ
nr:PREDICTED: uncharacterized protein LOC105670540 [Linepithema humile]